MADTSNTATLMALHIADRYVKASIQLLCERAVTLVENRESPWFDLTTAQALRDWDRNEEEDLCQSVMYLAWRGLIEAHPVCYQFIRFVQPTQPDGERAWTHLTVHDRSSVPDLPILKF